MLKIMSQKTQYSLYVEQLLNYLSKLQRYIFILSNPIYRNLSYRCTCTMQNDVHCNIGGSIDVYQ